MATLATQSSCFFIVTLLFICCLTEARESKFFSKYINLSKNNYVTLKESFVSSWATPPASAPLSSYISNAPTPLGVEHGYASAPLESGYAPAPLENSYAPAPLESENSYYGLYAKGTNDFPSESNTLVDDKEKDEFSNEELSNENPEEFNYEESATPTEAYSHNLNENNAFWTSNHESYKSQPEGMSDTRLMENGKYYYNADENEKYVNPNRDEQSRGNKHEGGDYYGYNEKSKYEFDSMEEYEKQEGYPDVQQEFVP